LQASDVTLVNQQLRVTHDVESGATFTKVSIYLAMTPACSRRNDEDPSAKDSISEFFQLLESRLDYIARRDLN